MTAPAAAPQGKAALREALGIWALSFAALIAAFLIAPAYAKLVATVSFLYLPLWPMRRRGEDYRDYGLTLRAWRADLAWALGLSALLLPPFIALYALYSRLLPLLPLRWAHLVAPLTAPVRFQLRLPRRFPEWVVDQLFVVALPEEFFYRGYLQARLEAAWPGGRQVLGVAVGRAFFATAALFAVGHLAIFQVWRLAVFFPALLFGWLRGRTGTVMGAALFHAISNLLMMVLEASFFGAT